jgi:hypothetical protein
LRCCEGTQVLGRDFFGQFGECLFRKNAAHLKTIFRGQSVAAASAHQNSTLEVRLGNWRRQKNAARHAARRLAENGHIIRIAAELRKTAGAENLKGMGKVRVYIDRMNMKMYTAVCQMEARRQQIKWWEKLQDKLVVRGNVMKSSKAKVKAVTSFFLCTSCEL